MVKQSSPITTRATNRAAAVPAKLERTSDAVSKLLATGADDAATSLQYNMKHYGLESSTVIEAISSVAAWMPKKKEEFQTQRDLLDSCLQDVINMVRAQDPPSLPSQKHIKEANIAVFTAGFPSAAAALNTLYTLQGVRANAAQITTQIAQQEGAAASAGDQSAGEDLESEGDDLNDEQEQADQKEEEEAEKQDADGSDMDDFLDDTAVDEEGVSGSKKRDSGDDESSATSSSSREEAMTEMQIENKQLSAANAALLALNKKQVAKIRVLREQLAHSKAQMVKSPAKWNKPTLSDKSARFASISPVRNVKVSEQAAAAAAASSAGKASTPSVSTGSSGSKIQKRKINPVSEGLAAAPDSATVDAAVDHSSPTKKAKKASASASTAASTPKSPSTSTKSPSAAKPANSEVAIRA